MIEKLSECCGAKTSWDVLADDESSGMRIRHCTACGKPCTIASKPDDPSRLQEAAPGAIERIMEVVSKPDERLLTEEEIEQAKLEYERQFNTHSEKVKAINPKNKNARQLLATLFYEGRKISVQNCVAKAQDAKTYPLAFEAGRKSQVEKDKHEIKRLQAKINKYLTDENGNDVTVACEKCEAEAKKQGARAEREWVIGYCKLRKTTQESWTKNMELARLISVMQSRQSTESKELGL